MIFSGLRQKDPFPLYWYGVHPSMHTRVQGYRHLLLDPDTLVLLDLATIEEHPLPL